MPRISPTTAAAIAAMTNTDAFASYARAMDSRCPSDPEPGAPPIDTPWTFFSFEMPKVGCSRDRRGRGAEPMI